jgi:hypothetical protein
MNIDDKLSQVFDVEPIPVAQPVVQQPLVTSSINTQALDDDYETTRTNLHSLLTQGQDALFHALAVAKNSEHPRAFEVVGGLMKHVADINHQLLDLHKKRQQIEIASEKKNGGSETNVTNNAIFVGSTNELSKMLNDLRKGK